MEIPPPLVSVVRLVLKYAAEKHLVGPKLTPFNSAKLINGVQIKTFGVHLLNSSLDFG